MSHKLYSLFLPLVVIKELKNFDLNFLTFKVINENIVELILMIDFLFIILKLFRLELSKVYLFVVICTQKLLFVKFLEGLACVFDLCLIFIITEVVSLKLLYEKFSISHELLFDKTELRLFIPIYANNLSLLFKDTGPQALADKSCQMLRALSMLTNNGWDLFHGEQVNLPRIHLRDK